MFGNKRIAELEFVVNQLKLQGKINNRRIEDLILKDAKFKIGNYVSVNFTNFNYYIGNSQIKSKGFIGLSNKYTFDETFGFNLRKRNKTLKV